MANVTFIFYLLAAFIFRTFSRTTDFCNFECGQNHTVCSRIGCGPSPKCGNQFEMKRLTPEERKTVLKFHNQVRNRISAQKKKKLFPPAANMKLLSYSKEIEFVAQCWANACLDQKDICRSVSRYNDVNQLIFVRPNMEDVSNETELFTEAFLTWLSEEPALNRKWVAEYPLKEDKAGVPGSAFSQIIWANTGYVGCGSAIYGTALVTKYILVCNYAPAGLKINEPVYKTGTPCSNCPLNFKCDNAQWPNLCVDPKASNDDEWVIPYAFGSAVCYKHTSDHFIYVCFNIYFMLIHVIY